MGRSGSVVSGLILPSSMLPGKLMEPPGGFSFALGERGLGFLEAWNNIS